MKKVHRTDEQKREIIRRVDERPSGVPKIQLYKELKVSSTLVDAWREKLSATNVPSTSDGAQVILHKSAAAPTKKYFKKAKVVESADSAKVVVMLCTVSTIKNLLGELNL